MTRDENAVCIRLGEEVYVTTSLVNWGFETSPYQANGLPMSFA